MRRLISKHNITQKFYFKLSLAVFSILSFIILLPAQAQAANILGEEVDTTSIAGVDALLAGALKYALFIAGAISVIFVIVGGIQYITSAGSPDAAKKAKTTITMALAGLVLVLCASLIINFTITVISR